MSAAEIFFFYRGLDRNGGDDWVLIGVAERERQSERDRVIERERLREIEVCLFRHTHTHSHTNAFVLMKQFFYY